MKRYLLLIASSVIALFFWVLPAHASTFIVTATGSGSWTVPTGVTSVQVQLWGGGGGGNANSFFSAGGAAAYVNQTGLSVTGGGTISYNIASGGAGGLSTSNAAGGTGYMSGGAGASSTVTGGGGGSTDVVVGGTTYIASGGGGAGGDFTGVSGASGSSGGAGGTGHSGFGGGGGGSGTSGGSAVSGGAGGTSGTTQTGTNGGDPGNTGGGGSSAGASGNGANGNATTGANGSGGAAGGGAGIAGANGTGSDSGGGGGGSIFVNGGAGGQAGAGGGAGGGGKIGGAGGPGKLIITYTGNFSYYRAITVTSTASVASGTNVNFPMLFGGTYSWLEASSSGGRIQNLTTAPNGGIEPADLIFVTSTPSANGSTWNCGTSLPFETENYVSSTGVINDWVSVPSVSTGTVIYACYGATGVMSDQSNPQGTWNSNYRAVYHLTAPTGTLNVYDSTANANNGTNNGSTATSSGQIDGAAQLLSASSQYIATPSVPATTTISFSVWFKSIGSPSTAVLLNTNFDGSSVPFMLCLGACGGGSYNGIAYYNGSWVRSGGGSAAATLDNNWHYIVGTDDGTALKLYVDGVLNFSGGTSGVPGANANNLDIGRYLNDGVYANGTEDEVEVYNGTLSPSWIATEYSNQNSPSTFYAVGSEQTAGGGGGGGSGEGAILFLIKWAKLLIQKAKLVIDN